MTRRKAKAPAARIERTDPLRINAVNILWSENPIIRVSAPRTYSALADADAALARAFAVSPPPADGYDKTDFYIVWSDGRIHDGRLDVTPEDARLAPARGGMLRHHLRRVARWYRDHSAASGWWSGAQLDDRQAWGVEMLRRIDSEPPLATLARDDDDDDDDLGSTEPPADGRGRRNRAARVRLSFRPVGETGEPYPPWVQDLRGRSGVYIIRERQDDGTKPVVYVGQSSVGRLYETLTRHFQAWRRRKGFWRGYHTGHDPGLTYDRGACEAAVAFTAPDNALAREAQFIASMRPRDNLLGQPADNRGADAVPF